MIALFFFILQGIGFAGIAVTPLQQWVEAKPGRNATFYITVTNNKRNEQGQPCPVKVNILDFTVSETGQLSFGPEQKHARSAADWISIEENKIVFESGESRKIKFNVSVPMNADGDYWAAAMIEIGETREGEKGVQVKFRTGSGIFIHVARRNYIERGSIIESNVNIPEFATTDNLTEEISTESASEEVKKDPVFKINAKLKNDGLVAILARGKAYLYSNGWRRVATIPLHAGRRRVLPDDDRWFTGVMAQPLPAGDYKLRVFFASDSKYKRTMTRDMEFSISDEKAVSWMADFVNNDSRETLGIKPQNIALQLNPGRLTAARFQVTNQTLGTVLMNCSVEGEGASADWIEMKTIDFTLAPKGSHSAACLVKVPVDAKAGEYKWTINIETERPSLSSQGENNIERYKIPLSVVVDDTSHLVVNK